MLLDEVEGGGIPEAGGPPVAEQDLVALGEVEEIAQPGADLADHRLDRLLAVAGPEVVRGIRRKGLDLRSSHLGGAGAESAIAREEFSRDADVRDVGHM